MREGMEGEMLASRFEREFMNAPENDRLQHELDQLHHNLSRVNAAIAESQEKKDTDGVKFLKRSRDKIMRRIEELRKTQLNSDRGYIRTSAERDVTTDKNTVPPLIKELNEASEFVPGSDKSLKQRQIEAAEETVFPKDDKKFSIVN